MIADYLHSFYRMPVNLVIGGLPTVCTLRWFKAPAGAKRLPFPSAIFSHVWDNNPGESVPGEIGEVGTPRTWDPGNNLGYQGQCYRGDPAWFATGNLPPLASIAPSPCLCVIPPAVGSGTLVLGGSGVPFCQPFFLPPGHTPTASGVGPGFNLTAGPMVFNSAFQAWIRGFSFLAHAWSLYWFGGMGGRPGCGQVALARSGVFPGELQLPIGGGLWVPPPTDSTFAGVVWTVLQT